jgi:hypothetical protein
MKAFVSRDVAVEVLLSKSTGKEDALNSNGNPFCNVRGLLMSQKQSNNRDNPFSSDILLC